MDRKDLLDITTDIAAELLCSGAEIYRVEESVLRIFHAYGETKGEIFAIPSLLLISIRPGGGADLVEMRRLREQAVDLEKIGACNDLCRRICKELPSKEAIEAQLNRIRRMPRYPAWVDIAAFAVISFGFTVMFGGSLWDGLAALLAGAVVRLVLKSLQSFETNSFFCTILASFAAAATACLCVALGLGQLQDKIIIGTLMTLVPGMALTNTMRDIMASDLIAGIMRLATVLLTAGGIALGSGAALGLFRFLEGLV